MTTSHSPYSSSFASVQNQSVQNASNPPYMLSTTPHAHSKQPGHSAPLGLSLYKRSFQGPFPSISEVDFTLNSQNSNNLLVKAVPFKGGLAKKKSKGVKKSATKNRKLVKKSIIKRRVPVKKSKSVKKSIIKRRVPVKKSKSVKKSIIKRRVPVKKSIGTKKKVKGGIKSTMSK